MGKIYQGGLSGQGLKIGVVVSRFNSFITLRLLEGAKEALARHDVDDGDVDVAHVPGSFELPLVAKKMAQMGLYDAVICLGAVIKGETPHFEYVAAAASQGIVQAGLDTGVPIIFGVITADTLEQAIERAGTKAGNKGYEAAVSAIDMANLAKALEGG